MRRTELDSPNTEVRMGALRHGVSLTNWRAADVDTAILRLLDTMHEWGCRPGALQREGLRRKCRELMEGLGND